MYIYILYGLSKATWLDRYKALPMLRRTVTHHYLLLQSVTNGINCYMNEIKRYIKALKIGS